MATPFTRTLRALKADRPGRNTTAVLIAAAILGAWLAWFLLGRVTVYEVTDRARLEVECAAHPLAALVGGRVVTTHLALGREVHAGETIVELDAEHERLALEEAKVRLKGLRDRLRAVEEEIQAETNAAEASKVTADVARRESEALIKEAEARAQFAEFQAASLAALREQDVGSEQEFREAKANAESNRATVRVRQLALTRTDEEYRHQYLDRLADIAELKRTAVEVQAQIESEEAAIRRLDHEISLRRLRAPVDGRIGKATELRVGTVVKPGDELGAIIPSGKPHAVAFFPVAAVGRIQGGQAARLRLEGFPWTRFGTPRATVADIGNEPVDGFVRVELNLVPDSAPAIPLEHGLPGTAEVAVERLSPAELVLRAAGRLLMTRDRSSPTRSPAEVPAP